MNTDKFTGKADQYAKFRPQYSEAFLDYLYNSVGFSDNVVVADIGSGTGIFSKQLLRRGTNVICIEPNDEMMSKAKEYLAEYDGCKFISAPSEATTLKKDSVDFITVAQAFHWFDLDRFRTECQRILRRSGKVVLIWNSRVRGKEIHDLNNDIIIKYCENFIGNSGGVQEDDDRFKSFFKNEKFEYREFENTQYVDLDRFIGGNLSASYAPKEDNINYENFISELRDLFDKYSEDGQLELPMITRAYVGKVM